MSKTISELTESTAPATSDIFAMVVGGNSRKVTLANAFKAFNLFPASNVLEQRNGATGQRFSVYNTYTDASNYERGELAWTGNELFVRAVAAGTGTQRELSLDGSNLRLRTGGATRWSVLSTAHLAPASDAGVDVGQPTLRVRRTYTQVVALIDGITAPSAITGHALLYVDTADGDLKVIFGDGTVKTISVDT